MKSFIVFALFVAAAVAVPVDPKDATIVRYDNDNIGVEGYNYAYQTSDGKAAEEQGVLTNPGTENEGIEVRGQFSYVGENGVNYLVTYTAGKNGFVPVGEHIPKA